MVFLVIGYPTVLHVANNVMYALPESSSLAVDLDSETDYPAVD